MTGTQLTIDDAAQARAPIRNDLERKYRIWKATHVQVFALFDKFALQILAHNRRFGIALLQERVRWEIHTTWAEDAEGYKINNNYRAYIARDLIAAHPGLAPLIETRKIRE
jgi:hypothetical protein